MEQKTVLFHTDSSLSKTGFGRSIKEIMMRLHKTGKYKLIEFCCGKPWSNDAEHLRKPWKSFGGLPDNPAELNALAPNDESKRLAAYGIHLLDKVIYQEKPDVYFGIQDIWGIDYAADRAWFNKITSVFWTTLDSLPIIPSALALAPKVKNFWVWSKFAETAMKKLGYDNVRTVHGAIDDTRFFKFNPQQKMGLRQFHGIPMDAFIIGFVFRNQPRKSVPNLLEGFKLFKINNPHVKNPRLLLHTHWNEGWKIHDFADELKIPHQEILTTYICEACRSYKVQTYTKEHIACPYCGNTNSFVSTHPSIGVSEEQLNEVYNLMDVYCHPFTSGGQEIPIQEAKFTELITLVTNYSCGEEMCEDGACSLPLEWQGYREPGSQFIKATTSPYSINKQLTKVLNMKPQEKERMGLQAREWALKNFSAKAVSKILEDFIDAAPVTNFDFIQLKEVCNPYAEITPGLNDEEWTIQLYERILGKKVDKYDSGVRNWISQLKIGAVRQRVEDFFRQTATQKKIAEQKQHHLDKVKADVGKKILYVMPTSERDMFLSTSLFRSIKEQYPDYKFYVATEAKYLGTLDGNPYVDATIPYFQEMDSLVFLEGASAHEGYFDIAFLPFLHTQRVINYIHNGSTRIAFGDCIKY